MPAAYSDIFLEQGADFNTQITLDDVNGDPFNLTGFSVKSVAKNSYYSANATIVFDATVYDANNGIIQLSSPASVTANVSPRQKLVYDILLIDSSNNVTRVVEGQVLISPGVTIY